MPKKYDWEAFLTEREKAQMPRIERLLTSARSEAKRLQANRDTIRRKAVGRARNAELKQARQAQKERV